MKAGRLLPVAFAALLAGCSPPAPPPITSDAEPAATVDTAASDEPEVPAVADLPEVDLPPVPAALQPVEEFEERALPEGIEAEGGGAVEITTVRSKSGVRSVRWQWSGPTDALWIRRPADLARWATLSAADQGRATLAFWCHRQAPGGFMTVEFHSASGVVARGGFPTAFKGWRPLAVRWKQVLKSGSPPIVALRIRPPAGEAKGELHLDRLGLFLAEQPPDGDALAWSSVPDPVKAARSIDPTDLQVDRTWLTARRDPVPAPLLADAARLTERIAGKPGAAPAATRRLTPQRRAELMQRLARYRLRRQGEVRAGVPVQGGGFFQPPGSIPFSTVCDDLGHLGRTYREIGDPADRNVVRDWIRDVVANLIDHGWAPGNSMYGNFMAGYGERGWPAHLFTCREAIGDTPEWADLMRVVIWWYGGPNMVAARPWGDTDIHLNGSPNVLQAIARLPPGAEQVQCFEIFKRYLDETYVQDTLIADDGTAHHHGMFHLAYASYSVPPMVNMVTALEGTAFAVEPAVIDRLKAYAKTVAWVSHLHDMPVNVNARAGDPMSTDISGMALTLARMRGALDRDMAGLFLAKNARANHPAVAELKAAAIRPDPLHGHRVLNFGGGAIHRRDDWMASLFGMNNFTRGLEIYGWIENNNYGRYARNGSILIQGRGARTGGFRREGWNWCFWPGATSLVRPSHEMYDYYGLYGMSGSALAGGTALNGNGYWALDFKGRDMSFRKSALCVDNRITVVTTDVASKAGRPTVTTLFQNYLEGTNLPTGVNGRGALKPVQLDVPTGAAWLFDTCQNGYILPAQRPIARMHRGPQSWTYMFERYLRNPGDNPLTKSGTAHRFRHADRAANEAYYKPLQGSFERAWLEHGTNPTNGSCWYTILIDSTPVKTEAFGRAMGDPARAPVRLLQANRSAHVVYDAVARVAGYAIFDPAGALAPAAPLESVSAPCVVMLGFQSNRLDVSVSQPDPARPAPIDVVLRGDWIAESTEVKIGSPPKPGQTRVSVPVRDLLPLAFPLRRATSSSPAAP